METVSVRIRVQIWPDRLEEPSPGETLWLSVFGFNLSFIGDISSTIILHSTAVPVCESCVHLQSPIILARYLL